MSYEKGKRQHYFRLWLNTSVILSVDMRFPTRKACFAVKGHSGLLPSKYNQPKDQWGVGKTNQERKRFTKQWVNKPCSHRDLLDASLLVWAAFAKTIAAPVLFGI